MVYIKIGDTVRITYEGENAKPKYHKYKVEKDGPEEENSEEESSDKAKEESKD